MFRYVGRERKINCRYLSFELPNGRRNRLPLTSIEVSSETDMVSTVALIDSGANTSFLPREIAQDILNLPVVRPETDVTGAGSSFSCSVVQAKSITLKAGRKPFCVFENPLLHVPFPNVPDLDFAILGRDTIFRAYEITFRENEEKYILRR